MDEERGGTYHVKLIKALENITKELKKISLNTEDIGGTLGEIVEHEDEEEEQE